MQAKRARRVPHAADARQDHFDLDAKRAFPLTPEDATAESVSRFGEEARRAAQESAKDKYSGF